MLYTDTDLKKDIEAFCKERFEKLKMEMLQKGLVYPECYFCYYFPQYLKFKAIEFKSASDLIARQMTPYVRPTIQAAYDVYKKNLMSVGAPDLSAVICVSDMFVANYDHSLEKVSDWRQIKPPSQRVDRREAIAFYISLKNENAIYYYFYERKNVFITFDLKNPEIADYGSVVDGGHLQNIFPK